MIGFTEKFLIEYGVNEGLAFYISNIIIVIFIFILSQLVNIIVKKVLLRIIHSYVVKTKNTWDDIIMDHKVFERLTSIIPIGVIHIFASVFPKYELWIQKIALSCIILIVLRSLHSLLDAINVIYTKYEISKAKPIKGYLQVIEIIVYTIGIIVVISVLLNRSPLILLSGIGAATAVLLLVFQNSILGLVASIQISSNNMLKIGDWMEMSKFGANGEVLEISLHTVKVQNWDKTIVSIPTHILLSESFTNWQGMIESGGRRIMRSIYIDITSIEFCSQETLERLSEIEYIKEYIQDKNNEIDVYNKNLKKDRTSQMVNGRHLTNIGVFRVYIENYLKNNPKINQNMLQIVRQLQPTENGLPIQLYIFTIETGWVKYEAIQSDIFDHLFAIAPEFNLRIYQAPTGHDLNRVMKEKN